MIDSFDNMQVKEIDFLTVSKRGQYITCSWQKPRKMNIY